MLNDPLREHANISIDSALAYVWIAATLAVAIGVTLGVVCYG